jgi:DNA-binding FadR family transcriptional regulator
MEVVYITVLQRKTLVDGVTDQTLAAIRSEKYPVGSRLPSELELAGELNVGRTTIREALQRLAAMGVIGRDRRGMRVLVTPDELTAQTIRVNVAVKSIHSLYEARRFLEVTLVRLAAERANEQDLARMRQAVAQLAEASPSNWDDVLKADMAFHTRIAEAAHNEVLAQLFGVVRSLVSRRLPSLSELSAIIQRSLAQHWEVYQAIADRDADRAVAIMIQNLSNSEMMLLERLENQPDPSTE